VFLPYRFSGGVVRLTAYKKGKIIVCSAPSGAGKTTLVDHLRATFPELCYSVSATTRPPRSGEKNGVHYFFLSVDEFRRRADAGMFAEWKMVHGNYYGTPKAFVDQTIEAGKNLLMNIDVQGKVMFDAAYPDAYGILILPPSLQILEQRLRGRRTDSEEDIRIRLENARKEIEFARTGGKYEYTLINDDLRRAKDEIVRITREIFARP